MQSKKIVFIDTETSGFWKAPTGNFKKDPWIVELGIVLAEVFEDGTVIEIAFAHNIIQSNGRYINPHAAAVHGINEARSMSSGRPEKEVMYEASLLINQADVLCCHNTDFDYKFVYDAMVRNKLESAVSHISFIPHICTMKATIDLCQLPFKSAKSPRGKGQQWKWPKLEELHHHLFGELFEGAHSAIVDIRATIRCFTELLSKNLVDFELFEEVTDETTNAG